MPHSHHCAHILLTIQTLGWLAGCSIGRKSHLLHVSGWDGEQAKDSKYILKYIFQSVCITLVFVQLLFSPSGWSET